MVELSPRTRVAQPGLASADDSNGAELEVCGALNRTR
jgi:hypothetical protein